MYTGEKACVCWQGSQKDQQPGKNIDREMCSRSEWSCGGRRRNIFTSGYSSLLQTISRLLLGLFSGHHTSPLAAEYENSGTSTTWPTRKERSQGVCVWKDSKFKITSFTREETVSRWVGFHGHIGYYYLTIVCLSFSGLSYFGRPVWWVPQQRCAWVYSASCM